MLNKGIVYVGITVFALLLLSVHHLGYSLGDDIFRLVGLSPWSGGDDLGLHWPVIIGIILIIIGIRGTTNYYRSKYPHILRWMIISCICFIAVFPFVSEKTMFLVKYNTTGASSMDYKQNKSHCNYRVENNETNAYCSLIIYNYGNESSVYIMPVLKHHITDINFEPQLLSLRPHSRIELNAIPFIGKSESGERLTGGGGGATEFILITENSLR